MSQPDDRPPIARALDWVSQITTVGFVMALPPIAGDWLDDRWGTTYWAPAGVIVGVTVGMWYLLRITGAVGTEKKSRPESQAGKPGRKESQTDDPSVRRDDAL